MTLDLAFTPSGRIAIHQTESDRDGAGGQPPDRIADRRLARVIKAFESSPAEGLFTLASHRLDMLLSPSFGFWRDFATRYLSELCQTPEGADTEIEEIPLPGPGELASMLLRGHLSEHVMQVVTDRQKGLFPLSGEMSFDCDCPDWATMCKHIAAVLYGIGSRLDRDPALLFQLRGANHDELIEFDAEVPVPIAAQSSSAKLLAADVFGIDLLTDNPVPSSKSGKTTASTQKRTLTKKKKTLSVKKSPAGKKSPSKRLARTATKKVTVRKKKTTRVTKKTSAENKTAVQKKTAKIKNNEEKKVAKTDSTRFLANASDCARKTKPASVSTRDGFCSGLFRIEEVNLK